MVKVEHMCYYAYIQMEEIVLKVLPVAVEKKRWDLVAHTLVLTSASVLCNGNMPHIDKKVSGNLLPDGSAARKTVFTGGEKT
ncbi:hypothetical protein ACFLUP_03455 [Chloroflexota bacterium]